MKRLLAICALGMFSLVHLCRAQVTQTVNFDNVADGTLINNSYAALGVTFECKVGIDPTANGCLNANVTTGYGGNVYAKSPVPPCSAALSAPNVVSIPSSPCGDFNERNGYIVAHFKVPAISVSIMANAIVGQEIVDTTTNMPYMNAYDSTGKWLATAKYSSSPLTNNVPGWVQLTITSSMVNNTPIGMVLFSSTSPLDSFTPVTGQFDNLSFTVPSTTVPNVVDMTLANAESAFATQNLAVGTISQQPSSTVPAGDVIGESPAAGTTVGQGSAVNLVESCGAPVPVPNVLGLTASAAESRIVAAGLTAGTVTYVVRNSYSIGNVVVSTNPAAFTGVCPSTPVNLVISLSR